MTQQDMIERVRLVNQLSWDAIYAADKFKLSKWTRDQLSERYAKLCDLVPACPAHLHPCRTLAQYRIDDGYIAWQKKHEAETVAIERELHSRSY